MAAWLKLNRDGVTWYLNPAYITTAYRNNDNGVDRSTIVICMQDGSDWEMPFNSPEGQVVRALVTGVP